jgi:hypothetical protein
MRGRCSANGRIGTLLTPSLGCVIVHPRYDCGALPEEKGPARKAGSNCGGATPPGASNHHPAHDEDLMEQAPGSAVPTTRSERPRKAGAVQDELLADGSMVLYHTGKRELLTLNPTAALIWECCDGEHSVAAIAAEMREIFPGNAAIETDVLHVLRDLIERGIVTDADV